MNFIEILLISLSMSMDAFVVCLGVGAARRIDSRRSTFRLAFHFGLFQFIMPVLGWIAGTTILHYIAAYDHWVAFGLLGSVGLRMIISGFNPESNAKKNDPSRGWSLVLLSVATSIDALVVGFSLGVVGITIWYPAAVIGLVTGLVSLLGLHLGNKLGEKFGKRMEILGGIVLVLIGVRVLLSHLLG
jgi:putative Mn2+ efflux pump MntP